MFIQVSHQNRAGFTLIEVMVAMGIMMVGLLGLLKSIEIANRQNMNNQQREEVVRVAERAMQEMRSESFDKTVFETMSARSGLRGTQKKYIIIPTVSVVGNSKKYEVRVRWKYGNYSTTHAIVTIRSK